MIEGSFWYFMTMKLSYLLNQLSLKYSWRAFIHSKSGEPDQTYDKKLLGPVPTIVYDILNLAVVEYGLQYIHLTAYAGVRVRNLQLDHSWEWHSRLSCSVTGASVWLTVSSLSVQATSWRGMHVFELLWVQAVDSLLTVIEVKQNTHQLMPLRSSRGLNF